SDGGCSPICTRRAPSDTRRSSGGSVCADSALAMRLAQGRPWVFSLRTDTHNTNFMSVTQATANINGKPLTFETGKYAKQAGGAVTCRYGDTIVFAAGTVAKTTRPNIDFFPLTVDFEERLYAAGKIPGSFPRREGRPSEEGILTARLVARPIRPLFPKGFRNDVQIVVSAWSADQENDYDVLAVNAASAALHISNAPFEGP